MSVQDKLRLIIPQRRWIDKAQPSVGAHALAKVLKTTVSTWRFLDKAEPKIIKASFQAAGSWPYKIPYSNVTLLVELQDIIVSYLAKSLNNISPTKVPLK